MANLLDGVRLLTVENGEQIIPLDAPTATNLDAREFLLDEKAADRFIVNPKDSGGLASSD